jgi:hypothetical protein
VYIFLELKICKRYNFIIYSCPVWRKGEGTMNPPLSFNGYKVIDERVLTSHGSFRRVCYWIEGWHPELAQHGYTRFIFGLSGSRETELTRDEIYPISTFEVRQALHDSAEESCES